MRTSAALGAASQKTSILRSPREVWRVTDCSDHVRLGSVARKRERAAKKSPCVSGSDGGGVGNRGRGVINRFVGSKHPTAFTTTITYLYPHPRLSSLPPPPSPPPSCCAQTNGRPRSSVTIPSLTPSSLQRTNSITKSTRGSSGK